eukprot:2783134-Rhodomonas_salina.5
MDCLAGQEKVSSARVPVAVMVASTSITRTSNTDLVAADPTSVRKRHFQGNLGQVSVPDSAQRMRSVSSGVSLR